MKFKTEAVVNVVAVVPAEDDDELGADEGVIHAHVTWSGHDCDGRYSGFHDLWPHLLTPGGKPMDLNDPYLDFQFIDFVIADCVDWTGMSHDGELHVYFDNEPPGTKLCISWYAGTEEGKHSKQARICENPACEPEAPERRDHTAEAAGY